MSASAIPFPVSAELDSPAEVLRLLSSIENDLANRQNAFEAAAGAWYTAQREMKRQAAHALLGSKASSVTEKRAQADLAAYDVEGSAQEAEYESLKAVIRVLETRATVCMSILKAQGRS